MSGFLLGVFVVASGLSIAISVGSKIISDGRSKNNLLLVLGGLLFTTNIVAGIVTYSEAKTSRAVASQNAQQLNDEIKSLKGQNGVLADKLGSANASLGVLTDKLGDANARLEALATKLRAPAHLTRNISEPPLKTVDSVSAKINQQ